MELAKVYDPRQIESKWYQHWMEQGYFRSVPDAREPYTIVIPPPNVTGVLHMGHMLNNTLQDVLVRRARMLGKNACWVPGTDHASIATEARVVAMLREKGIDKKDLTRQEFLAHAWEWKEKYGGIILEQLKKLGASCDWERTRFTMEDELSAAVINVFVNLYNKGHIYRGVRMVNWDPKGKTAVSDEEVIYKDVKSKLYYVQYQIEGEADKFVTIATTRPETILGDSAVCVHPDDERYKNLKGKKVIIPIVNRVVPVIFDTYVTMEFGTGCLKVTPAHDINDYNLGIKHNLETIDILNVDGTLSETAGAFVGKDRFEARKLIVAELETMGILVKTEDIVNNVGHSERTDAVIEPKLSMQWFMNMDTLSKPALTNVMNDTIQLVPDKFKNTYRHWMENVKDWCISRQLWWGQQIPAFYLPDGSHVVATTAAEALALAQAKQPTLKAEDLRQDEDVLDTWFSSWLWPISVFDGFKDPENADIKYYYPTNDLVTAPEILFFWVARMIIAGYEYRGEQPFKNVYLTGIVRDKQGRKMSKSLGNSPEPMELMDQYGADGVRAGMLFSSPAGNDLLFDEGLCEQGRNFSNKLWNALRLVKGWETVKGAQEPAAALAIEWFGARLAQETATINDHFSKFRISDALMSIYKLIWDDFCAWYLELVKPGYQQPLDEATYQATVNYFEQLLKLLHPFMPFITEEAWHTLADRKKDDCIMLAQWPAPTTADAAVLANFEIAMSVISELRNIRKDKNIPYKETISVMVKTNESKNDIAYLDPVISKLCNVAAITRDGSEVANAMSFVVQGNHYFVPMEGKVDVAAELEKLHKELAYAKGFLKSVEVKLNNERFMANAKADVVQAEKNKQEDALSKIKALEEQIVLLK